MASGDMHSPATAVRDMPPRRVNGTEEQPAPFQRPADGSPPMERAALAAEAPPAETWGLPRFPTLLVEVDAQGTHRHPVGAASLRGVEEAAAT